MGTTHRGTPTGNNHRPTPRIARVLAHTQRKATEEDATTADAQQWLDDYRMQRDYVKNTLPEDKNMDPGVTSERFVPKAKEFISDSLSYAKSTGIDGKLLAPTTSVGAENEQMLTDDGVDFGRIYERLRR
jgi:hypothetical protein